MKINWNIHTLKLKSDFRIAKGTYSERRVLIISLEQDGKTGYGEATEILYYNINLEQLGAVIDDNIGRLSAIPLRTTDHYFERIVPILGEHRFLLSAFDCAAHDLSGKLHGAPLSKLWSLSGKPPTPTFYTVGLGPAAEMRKKIRDFPWPRYKIKLDGNNDLELLGQLRQETSAPFLIDANEAWSFKQLKEGLPQLTQLNVIAIEQPLPRTESAKLRNLSSPDIPILADESCHTPADVETCAGLFSGINIKLMKCGGLTPAKKMIQRARDLGLKVMIGCMTESTIGISAGAHLIPYVDFVDLDGALLIENDLAEGLHFNDGFAHFTDKPGLGFSINSMP